MLTSHLGDPESKPLTVAQFRRLTVFARNMERPSDKRDLTAEDIMSLGYDRPWAERIMHLLSRQEQLEYYVNQAAKYQCYPITRISSHYPEALRNRLGNDAPGCLWAKGDASLLNCPGVSVVGSRDLREENLSFAAEVGRQAAKQGYILISGNARGADRVAQDSCLENGGKVISIVADSLKKCKAHPNVLYLSEDGFDVSFSAIRALSRNRLIHSMGLVTLVCQCTLEKGGTWSGTTQNLQHHLSPVYCFQDGSAGVEALLQMGAAGVSTKHLEDFSSLPQIQMNMFE